MDRANWSRWSGLRTWFHRIRPLRVAVLLLPLLGLVALNTMDYWMPALEDDSGCSTQEQGVSLSDRVLFGYLLLPRKSRPSTRVSLVTMGEQDGSDLLTNVCSGRRFTAKIVDALNRLGAGVIALDKTYSEGSCNDQDANKQLVDAVQASKAKVVAGQGTEAAAKGAKACLVKTKNFPFGTADVKRGITRVNEDDRKIPLRWPVYANLAESKTGQPPSDKDGESFALVTAKVANAKILEEPTIAANLDRHSHPYGDFREIIAPIPARQVLCNAREAEAPTVSDSPCDGHMADLRGRVVVVASESSTDMHPFLDKEIPGATLQAQYISALLSGRYYSELPFWWCFVAFALWVLGILWFVDVRSSEQTKKHRLLIATAVSFAFAFIALFLPQLMDTVPPISFLVAAAVVLMFEWTAYSLERGKGIAFGGGSVGKGGMK